MISVFKGASVSAVGKYFQQPDYYTKDGEGAEGIWLGGGAKALKLHGRKVEQKDFVKYLDGRFPGARPLGRIENNTRQRVPGWDNTMSSPAGSSIAIEVLGDKALESNHEKAAKSVVKFIETNSLAVRKNRQGKQVTEKDRKGLIACFKHRVSRNLDPQTHTHLFFINAAIDKDGKWLSVESQASFYETKMLHGIIARSEEAYGAKSLGRDIMTYSKDGKYYWDLRAIDSNLKQAFSTRSRDMAEWLGEGKHSAKTKANAALATRKAKQTSSVKALKASWEERFVTLGYNIDEVRENVMAPVEIKRSVTPRKAFTLAVSHLSEGNSRFTHNELLYAMLSRSLGDVRYPDANREIARAIREDRLVLTHKGPSPPDREFTTPALQKAEKDLITYEMDGRSQRPPLYSRKKLEGLLRSTSLNEDQAKTMRAVLLGTHTVSGIQGLAGVGKSYLAKHLADAMEKAGFKPIILAPSSSVVTNATNSLGRKAETLQSYLRRPHGGSKAIILVDEASMIGTQSMLDLLKIADARQINRVILMGDKKQLQSPQAGAPFELLQSTGMRTCIIDTVIRQQTENHREMIRHAAAGEIAQTFQILDKQLQEVSYEEMEAKTAQKWIESPNREKTAIIANTNSRVDAINTYIRESLIVTGDVAKDGIEHAIFRPMNLSKTDKSLIANYVHANAIRFYDSYRPLGIKANRLYKIDTVNTKSGRISLIGPDNKPIIFSPEKSAAKAGNFSVLREDSLPLSRGDKIVFTANDYNHKIDNQDRYNVMSIDGNIAHLRHIDGDREKHLSLDDTAMRFIRHGWAGTNHATQGKSVEGVIVAMSAHERMTDQASFYVGISRFKENVTYFTDDKDQLKRRLETKKARPQIALTHQDLSKIKAVREQAEAEKASLALAEKTPEPMQTRTHDFERSR